VSVDRFVPAITVQPRIRALTSADAQAGVIGRFRDVVRAQPRALAVADAEHELTYAQLADRAASVLIAIRDGMAALRPEPVRGGEDVFFSAEPVGLLHSHDVGAVVALLAVIASGHPVLVLDPKTPAPRLRQFVERAGVRLIVADGANEAVAEVLSHRVVVPLRGAPARADLLWEYPPDPSTAAAVAFTSGSTGMPKPVANDHRMLVRDAWTSSVATGCYGADDVIAHTLPMAFHAGLTTTVAGLVVGTTMRLYDARSLGIAGLPGWIAANGATVMISSPAILRAFVAGAPDPAMLTTLRSVNLAGEAVYGRDVEVLRALLPGGCVVRHRYGSSETGLIAEYRIGADHPTLAGAVPVGQAVPDTRLALVGPQGGEVAPGESGLITVTAPYVALGYWQEAEATASSFRHNEDGTCTYTTSDVGRFLPDGSLLIAGRADHSVKIRGYLVDPGEVDVALFALPEVREAVVVGLPRDKDGAMRLVAYVVSSAERPSAAGIRAALRGILPGHMVPETVVFLSAVPRSDRGKIDRAALPPPPAPAASVHEEYSNWEELVADVWADVLELEKVGLRDDFFELGGDSLAAEALISRLIAELGVSGDVATTGLLVQAPMLQEFAARLQQARSTVSGSLVPLHPSGTKLPLFMIAGGGGLGVAFVPWARRLGDDQPSWALQSKALEGRALPDRSVQSVARRYIATMRKVQPKGPYQLAGHSFGGLVAMEMAHQLSAEGEQVALLAILDSFPPNPSDHPATEPRSLVQRVRDHAGLALTALRSTPGGDQHWRFFNQSGELGRRYQGAPWPGRTLVVVADTPEKAQRSHWGPHLTGDWTLVEVAGDHITMTRMPWANEVADVLADAIEAARADRES
jgi:acyl-coenzyme A synthetase/AMP-(fatty) acid ligase/thioesterase domain-containing protein